MQEQMVCLIGRCRTGGFLYIVCLSNIEGGTSEDKSQRETRGVKS